MNINITSTEDFLNALREHPEFLEAARREILTQELLDLPTRFASFTEQADQRFDNVDQRLDDLDEGFGDVKGLLVGISTGVGNLSGLAVESVLQGRVLETAESRLNMAEPVVLVSMQLPNRVDVEFSRLVGAASSGESPSIQADAGERILDTDLIVKGMNIISGAPMYLAVEASYTMQDKDVTRADDTVKALRRMYPDALVIGAVFGVNISNETKRQARSRSLRIYEISLPT